MGSLVPQRLDVGRQIIDLLIAQETGPERMVLRAKKGPQIVGISEAFGRNHRKRRGHTGAWPIAGSGEVAQSTHLIGEDTAVGRVRGQRASGQEREDGSD